MRSPQKEAMAAAISAVARRLASPDGENAEYDRALVDLTSDILGLDKAEAARRILSPKSPLKFQ